MRAQDDERRRIARMLHETTAQDLAALKMLLAGLNRTLHHLSEHDRAVLTEAAELTDRTMAGARTLSYLLHPPLLDEAGLPSAVRWYAEGFAQRSGIDVQLDLPADLPRFPQDVETTLFRVVQEALINVHRHADSRTAAVRVRATADAVILEIEDHGHGMPPDVLASVIRGGRATGVGLSGMRERLQQLGGRLKIESSGRGTTIRAIVPASRPS
jgi:signal transduction histidine kinase